MNRLEIIDKIAQGKLTRREFKRALGAFGLTTITMPALVRPARAAGDIMFLTWAGFGFCTGFQAQ